MSIFIIPITNEHLYPEAADDHDLSINIIYIHVY